MQLCWAPDAVTLSAWHALSALSVACSFGVPVLRVPDHAAAAARLEGAPPLVRARNDKPLTADMKSGVVPYGVYAEKQAVHTGEKWARCAHTL